MKIFKMSIIYTKKPPKEIHLKNLLPCNIAGAHPGSADSK
jgi:hypothetical protein